MTQNEQIEQHGALQLKLEQILAFDCVENATLCEFSEEDSTPTIHVYLWRGFDLCDILIDGLEVVTEGFSDFGPVYSLQISND